MAIRSCWFPACCRFEAAGFEYFWQEKGRVMIEIENVSKNFVLHNQGGAVIPVMAAASLSVGAGNAWR